MRGRVSKVVQSANKEFRLYAFRKILELANGRKCARFAWTGRSCPHIISIAASTAVTASPVYWELSRRCRGLRGRDTFRMRLPFGESLLIKLLWILALAPCFSTAFLCALKLPLVDRVRVRFSSPQSRVHHECTSSSLQSSSSSLLVWPSVVYEDDDLLILNKPNGIGFHDEEVDHASMTHTQKHTTH